MGDEVLHTRTGLVWQRDCQLLMPWQDAINYVESLGNNWRLPTIDELSSLIDRTRYHPASKFPNMSARETLWSSSPVVADATTFSWSVNFTIGDIHAARTDHRRNARCIRSEFTDIGFPVKHNLSLTGRF